MSPVEDAMERNEKDKKKKKMFAVVDVFLKIPLSSEAPSISLMRGQYRREPLILTPFFLNQVESTQSTFWYSLNAK